jgi:hypothetical protein
MYVCMYVCMHACMYVCMHVCMYVYIYRCVLRRQGIEEVCACRALSVQGLEVKDKADAGTDTPVHFITR